MSTRIARLAVLLVLAPATAHPACNMIPQLPSLMTGSPGVPTPTPTATPLFYGRMSTIDQPFIAPGNWVTIRRRGCDQGANFSTVGAFPRAILVIDPVTTKGKPTALILEPEDVGCNADAVRQCDKDLNGVVDGDAKCLPIPNTDYAVVDAGVTLKIRIPDPASAYLATRTGSLTVAVTDHKKTVLPCKQLLQKKCSGVLPTPPSPAPDWHACIDGLFEDDVKCQYATVDETFPNLTMLPVWNDLQPVGAGAAQYCSGLAEEIRYTLDQSHNVLIPMKWGASLAQCGVTPCGLWVRGDFVPPGGRWFKLPDDDPMNPGKNLFLESYTPEGRQLFPTAFGKVDSGVSGASGILGTADSAVSVLRVAQRGGTCKAANGTLSSRRCSKPKHCQQGETCVRVCIGGTAPGTECSADTDCGGGGKCGKLHELRDAFAGGGWKLDRSDGAFCEEPSPSKACMPSSTATPCGDARCVRYAVYAGPEFELPSPTVAPSPDASGLVGALGGGVQIVQIVETQANVDGHGNRWIAAFVEKSSLKDSRVDLPPGKIILVVARTRTRGCDPGHLVCDLAYPYSESSPLLAEAGFAFVGTKLRFFSADPTVSNRKRSPFARALGWLSRRRSTEASTPFALLRIYDAAKKSPVTPIALVDLSDRRHYDPLVEHPSGSTTFLSPAGQCVRDGATLPVPSLCRPDAMPGDCPPASSCVPKTVVVATDLSTDLDEDGVPDVIRAPQRVPRSGGTTAAGDVHQHKRPVRKRR